MKITPRDLVAALLAQWDNMEIDKYDFYEATMPFTPAFIAEVTAIDLAVIKDRRRYLRQLAEQFA
jgi:hypothetical protein